MKNNNLKQERMSFFTTPVTNKRPNAMVGLADIYSKVVGDSYMVRTRTLRTINFLYQGRLKEH